MSTPTPIPTPPRRTLARTASISGLGLFSGIQSTLTLRPVTDAGPAASGIIFRRTDLPAAPLITATFANIVSEQRRTVLQAPAAQGAPAARVETVEHILAALAGMGITDALLDLDGPEVPIVDGSALPFVNAIVQAGITDRAAPPLQPIVISRPLTVGERGAQIDALPPLPGHTDAQFTYRLDYGPTSPIAAHDASISLPADAAAPANHFVSSIAPARTFCTLAEAQAMRQMGMFTKFEPRDMLVIGPDGPIDNTLRFPDEPARHKVLDMIGDLSLAGRPIVGRIIATRTGHALNHELARALASLPPLG